MNERDADMLRAEIARLLQLYPELADDEVLRADMLDGETQMSDVLTHLIREGEDAKAMKEATKTQQENLKARTQRFERRVAFTRELMLAILDAANLRKLELPEGTIFLRNNPQQVVGEPDATTLPDDLVKIERKPDRKAILAALKDGRELPGLVLSNSPPSIVVTVK
ncbi:siphovirus Gp157 family protein [Bradyrhizobium sp. SEMIA]|uniref:siphovirus Gp157 family protein n=1 Tax=Bradyrhizobium sp. SEMIA TaxID=2597515 RepID=UPI0018A4AFB8|nr:siphovirus Gp157 family protein [Bradyrhizobium sp. SEMIA]QOG21355.1 hypothetical protein FOM02_32635 [Bradyrhizobium sp. SEMIA]